MLIFLFFETKIRDKKAFVDKNQRTQKIKKIAEFLKVFMKRFLKNNYSYFKVISTTFMLNLGFKLE